MYTPATFAWTELDSLLALCRDRPFATVMTGTGETLEAQHLPLITTERDGRPVLYGHAARANPLLEASRVLAVFHGPHAFVSAAWYDEADTVPTWNYLAVHLHGRLTVLEDRDEIAMARDLLLATDPERQGWEATLSPAVAARLAGAIRWFRIDVDRWEGKAKLSQNHAPERRGRVIARLRSLTDPDAQGVAAAMEATGDGRMPWPVDVEDVRP